MPALDWSLDLIGLGASGVLMTLVWVGAFLRRDMSLVDRFWGLGFVVVAAVWAAIGGGAAAWLPLLLVALWGLRLSAYITWRNWGHGEDRRYAAMRGDRGRSFDYRALVTVHWLQAAILWVLAQPLFVAITSAESEHWTSPLAWFGVAVFAGGFLFEAVADWQMARFKANPANRGGVMDRGLWRYSRHPNYFGEILVWWGVWLLSLPAGGWWTVFAPVIMTVLMVRVTGVALLEKDLESKKPDYAAYIRRTNALIPGPPRSDG